MFWAQKVTDLYEKVTQNEPMDEAMDLHNNAIGRLCFLNFIEENEEEMVFFLQNKAQNARKVEIAADISKYKNQLVFVRE